MKLTTTLLLNTISPCIVWYSNLISTKRQIRSEFGISPEDLYKWSPSVSSDCRPWNIKYHCMVSEGRLAIFIATASHGSNYQLQVCTAVTTTAATAITASNQSLGAVRNHGIFIKHGNKREGNFTLAQVRITTYRQC
ncbi:hypothetical protein V8C42DRAFT_356376 [Trichoderma barbatum]